jgi:hypothetical protein
MGEKIGRREVCNPGTSGVFTDVSSWSALQRAIRRFRQADLNEAARAADAARGRVPTGWLN